jgi:AraC-like DNA-binding protein
MRKANPLSAVGARRKFYFENLSSDSTGYLLRGGISVSSGGNDLCDVRGLWAYPYYVLEIMLEGGSGSYRNESGFQCQLSYGNFFFVYPGIKQYYGPGKGENWSEICVSFAGQVYDLYRERGILHPTQPVWYLTDPAPWIAQLQDLLQQPRPTAGLECASETTRFLSFLFAMMQQATPVESSSAASDWFTQACSMLTNDLSHKSDLNAVAANLGMSYHTFRIYFTQRAGMSPLQYRTTRRIETARSLLTETDKTCKSIAFILGYCNGDHFSADFKQHMGLAPREYRKRTRSKLAHE